MCSPWKMTFTLVHLAPLIVFSAQHIVYNCKYLKIKFIYLKK
jgi:hypothetical protein